MRRKGFTLIELMIVLVVIGILAAMMMFSSTESEEMARTTKIINDLQMLKRAALSYYADHYDEFRVDYQKVVVVEDVAKYIGNQNDPDLAGDKYFFTVLNNNTDGTAVWFVYYWPQKANMLQRAGIRRRLEAKARSQQLWKCFFNHQSRDTIDYSVDDELFEQQIYTANDGEASLRIALRIR